MASTDRGIGAGDAAVQRDVELAHGGDVVSEHRCNTWSELQHVERVWGDHGVAIAALYEERVGAHGVHAGWIDVAERACGGVLEPSCDEALADWECGVECEHEPIDLQESTRPRDECGWCSWRRGWLDEGERVLQDLRGRMW